MKQGVAEFYLNISEQLVSAYRFNEPLHFFLKKYFNANRKLGSRDRKTIASLVYCFFRLGKALNNISFKERLGAALFLTQNKNEPYSDYYISTFMKHGVSSVAEPLRRKVELVRNVYPHFSMQDIFPLYNHLSESIDESSFIHSFLSQPYVWMRIKKEKTDEVHAEINQKQIEPIIKISATQLGFDAGIPLTKLDSYQEGFFEIQDLSSQNTGSFFDANKNEYWWDCCAGSGGKSLLFKDMFPETKLLVSDLRENILLNARERFRKARVNNFEIKVIDLLAPQIEAVPRGSFDGIILDAPCTGSGTWARNPEMINGFDENDIAVFTKKQKQFVESAGKFLKEGKPLVYITCSVFKEENENVVAFAETLGLKPIKKDYLRGYAHHADTLFAARLIKS